MIQHKQYLQFFAKALVITGILMASFAYSYAADLVVSPASGSFSAGQTFTATVRAVPGGDSVNAVEATMAFDSENLSVVSVSKTGSVFSLWTTEPTFSNAAGTISFGGGSPTPFTTTSNLLTVTFRTVGEGDGSVEFSRASVLAADGRGTDVYNNGTGANYTVAAATTPTPTPTPTPEPTTEPTPEPTTEPTPESNNGEEAIIFGDPPRPPEIGSQTFLDPEVWYGTVDGLFTWTLPFDVTAVAVEVTDDPDNIPQDNDDALVDPPGEEFAVNADNVSDGVQYISINFENQVGWGAVLNRQLKIDTTAPEPFIINVLPGSAADSFPLLNFAANDVTSGIDFYEMTIADMEPFTVTPAEAALGYLLGELEDGTYTVSVIAHDMAGNTHESSAAVLITSGWTKPVESLDEGSFWDFFTGTSILIFFLLLLITLMLVYMWHERRVLKDKEEKLRRETREIQDQMEKIFSALRDEIYDQINHITKRKRMSAKEKEAVESLTQALEVSETLIEKEISDVKSILR
jgi:hypothetical protein